MSDKKMIQLFKSIRIPFFLGQTILLVTSAYLLATKNENWLYPISLLLFQQIILWAGYIYYSKK